ncbi:serine dehydratase-like [Periplaneta americana]|uniref:serine dehydratase-like n=1 Tax=Periplaneta americana TaxID=6978 RepID=UPI0037E95A42
MRFEENPLHIITPLLRSEALTQLLPGSKDVYLKMENCQIAGSFKIRGFGRLAQKLKEEGCEHLVAATSGNTGAAVAYASKLLGIPCTVYLPETSPDLCAQKLRLCGAEVKVVGTYFNQTQEHAIEHGKKPGAAYVNPSHPEIWAGHSTVVDEMVSQLPSKPSVIVVAVGDGGLLIGVLQGLKRAGWQDVPLLAMETYGTDCFNLSVKANKIVALEEITSIAKCLGSRTVDPHLLEIMPQYNILSEVVSDAQAVESCIRFADDEHAVVEPGCGAALAALYSGILERLHKEGKIPHLNSGPAVIIVCGGRSVSLQLLQEWAKQFNVPFPKPEQG